MKYTILVVFTVLFIGSAYPEAQRKTKQPAHSNIANERIDPKMEREIHELHDDKKFEYLKSFLSSEEKIDNAQKSSAIRLLGRSDSTNAIPILIRYIDFRDTQYKDHPTVAALITIGESATPQLLDVVQSDKDNNRVAFAVEALMGIKGSEYKKFVGEQKDKLTPEAWKKLLRYSIN